MKKVYKAIVFALDGNQAANGKAGNSSASKRKAAKPKAPEGDAKQPKLSNFFIKNT